MTSRAILKLQLTYEKVTSMNTIKNAMTTFAREEEGAQIVEYGLIIAVVSIALILLLQGLTTDPATGFAKFIARVKTCLEGGTCA